MDRMFESAEAAFDAQSAPDPGVHGHFSTSTFSYSSTTEGGGRPVVVTRRVDHRSAPGGVRRTLGSRAPEIRPHAAPTLRSPKFRRAIRQISETHEMYEDGRTGESRMRVHRRLGDHARTVIKCAGPAPLPSPPALTTTRAARSGGATRAAGNTRRTPPSACPTVRGPIQAWTPVLLTASPSAEQRHTFDDRWRGAAESAQSSLGPSIPNRYRQLPAAAAAAPTFSGPRITHVDDASPPPHRQGVRVEVLDDDDDLPARRSYRGADRWRH